MGAMSYEETLGRLLHGGNTGMQRRGSGHLAVPRQFSDSAPRLSCWKRGDEVMGKPAWAGCMYVSA